MVGGVVANWIKAPETGLTLLNLDFEYLGGRDSGNERQMFVKHTRLFQSGLWGYMQNNFRAICFEGGVNGGVPRALPVEDRAVGRGRSLHPVRGPLPWSGQINMSKNESAQSLGTLLGRQKPRVAGVVAPVSITGQFRSRFCCSRGSRISYSYGRNLAGDSDLPFRCAKQKLHLANCAHASRQAL